jgi:hypothetical protein
MVLLEIVADGKGRLQSAGTVRIGRFMFGFAQ